MIGHMSTRIQRSLRGWVAAKIADHNTHATLRAYCERFGLTGDDAEGSKRDRAAAAVEGMSDHQIAVAAEKIAVHDGDIEMEEAGLAELEAGQPIISEITRREVARCFASTLLSGERPLIEFLREFWPIDSIWSSDTLKPLTEQIERHMLRNDDWSVEDLFQAMEVFKWSRRRFVRMIEAALDPRSHRDKEQDQLRDSINAALNRDGYKVEQADTVSGYPKYRVARMSGAVAGAPKNLIFASAGPKPDIGFIDAINNDIVILSNAQSCLVYDRPIGDDGLLWDDLVAWWRDTQCARGTDDSEARKLLGARLGQSLQSEGERNLFRAYFKLFRPLLRDALPALIPQVYLHYDPATIAQLREGKRLARQRMDFLLLLAHRNRVVVEVDGSQHFCDADGRPSLTKYAEMVREDRKLRLLGYEVFRFGAIELVGADAQEAARDLFERLLTKHGLRS